MNQATLELDRTDADTFDRAGFDIGWDHAHHGLVPPAELMHADTPVCQGWMAGRAVFSRRTPGHDTQHPAMAATAPAGLAARHHVRWPAGHAVQPGADPRHVVSRAAHAAGRARQRRLRGRRRAPGSAGRIRRRQAGRDEPAGGAGGRRRRCTRGRAPGATGRVCRRARCRARRLGLVAAGRAAVVRDGAAFPPGGAAAAGGLAAPLRARDQCRAAPAGSGDAAVHDVGLERSRTRDGRPVARSHPAPRLQPLRRRVGTAPAGSRSRRPGSATSARGRLAP